jgi:transposase-like protein
LRLGFHEEGERVLVGVCLGMRESHEDWLSLGRDLIARGLPAPMLIVADGAPGLIKAVEQCWPHSDRQHCSVHRARNLIAKLPEQERERVRRAYWAALDEAKDERDGKERLEAWSQSSSGPASPPPPAALPTTSQRSSSTCATRSGTASAGAAPTCSSGRSAR